MIPDSIPSPRIIGLTGGIATGKSTVAQDLATRYQLPILDADLLARQVVEPGTTALRQLRHRYGDRICLPDGQLDRPQLASMIFSDPEERRWVEAVIHPAVRAALEAGRQQWAATAIPIGVMVVPLLFEAHFTDLVSEIWVVACPAEVQLQRLMARDRISLAQAQARIASQMPLTEKIAQATVVLNNTSTLATLQAQVDAALRR